MGTDVTDLARAGLRNPRRVTVTVPSRGGRRYATPHEVRNSWAVVPQCEKLSALLGLLRELHGADGAGGAGGHKTMVFVLTCAAVEYLARLLPALRECAGLRVVGLHGQMPQKRRERTYAEFVAAREGVLLCTDVAARGLDVPGLSAVVQWDAPQDPAFAVHRAGRVGRLGQAAAGESVLLLAPSEESYVPLLRARGMGLQERPAPAGPPSSALLASARAALRGDRDLHQKSQRAFVSQVRAYRQHLCAEALPFEGLDLAGLAAALGLLRLPYMKELVAAGAVARRRVLELPGFEPDGTDVAAIPFRDRVRERARLARLAAEAEAAAAAARAGPQELRAAAGTLRARQARRNLAWSKKLDKIERREKRARRRAGLGPAAADGQSEEEGSGASIGEQRAEAESSEGEAEQLRREAALLRKLKARRTSREVFARETGLDAALEAG